MPIFFKIIFGFVRIMCNGENNIIIVKFVDKFPVNYCTVICVLHTVLTSTTTVVILLLSIMTTYNIGSLYSTKAILQRACLQRCKENTK